MSLDNQHFTNFQKTSLREFYNNTLGENFRSISQIKNDLNRKFHLGLETTEEVYEFLQNEYEDLEKNKYEIIEDVYDNVKTGSVVGNVSGNNHLIHNEINQDIYETPFNDYTIDYFIDEIKEVADWLKKFYPNWAISVNLIGYYSGVEDEEEKKNLLSVPIKNNNQTFINFVEDYLANSSIKTPHSGVVAMISSLKFKLVETLAGGSPNTNYSVERKAGFKIINFKSTNNDCLFKCIGHYVNEKINKSRITEIRIKYGLGSEKIGADMVSKICLEEFNLEVGVLVEKDESLINLLNDKDNKLNIFLDAGHYYIIKNVEIIPKIIKKVEEKEKVEKKEKNEKVEENKDTKIIHLDFETFTNKKGVVIPFIIGFEYFYNDEWVYETREGEDCVGQFYNFLETKKVKDCKYINAYNGSGFDFQILFNYLCENERYVENKNLVLAGNKIYRMEFCGMICFDLHLHITGSLSSNLKEFGCKTLKGEIDYNLFNKWELLDDELRVEIKKYLVNDVKGMRELYEKLNKNVFEEYVLNICDYMTISSLAWKVFTKNHYNTFTKMNVETASILRQALYGGRVMVCKKEYKSEDYDAVISGLKTWEEVNDCMNYLDKVSLYPTAMVENLFPSGNMNVTNIFVKDKLGIYQIKYITNKSLLYPVLPRRVGKVLVWDLLDSEGWYSSVDIKLALKNGYKIEIINGYYWSSSEYVFKSYINEMFDKKKKSKKGSAGYEMSKLMMNAIYGKCSQKDNLKSVKITDNVIDLQLLMDKNNVWIQGLNCGKTVLEYEPMDKSNINSMKPVYLSIFILSYSRVEMYKDYKKFNTIDSMFSYCDTDSLFVENKFCNDIRLGKEMGDLDNDIKLEGKIIRGIFIAPKLYCVEYINSLNEVKIKIVGKGVKAGVNDLMKRCLAFEDFNLMLKGESICVVDKMNIKKVGVMGEFKMKMNYNIPKVINLDYIDKRNFIGNIGLPYGHLLRA